MLGLGFKIRHWMGWGGVVGSLEGEHPVVQHWVGCDRLPLAV